MCVRVPYPGYLVCKAGVSCQDGMGSHPVLVLQGFEAGVGVVPQQVGAALTGNIAAHLLRQALPVVPPLLQHLLEGVMPHQARRGVPDTLCNLWHHQQGSSTGSITGAWSTNKGQVLDEGQGLGWGGGELIGGRGRGSIMTRTTWVLQTGKNARNQDTCIDQQVRMQELSATRAMRPDAAMTIPLM